MKKMFKAVLAVALSVVLMVPTMATMAQTDNSEIKASLETVNGATASLLVDNDYNVTVEASMTDFDLSNTNVSVSVTDIAGLGINGTKTFNKQVSMSQSFPSYLVSAAITGFDMKAFIVNVCDVEGATMYFEKDWDVTDRYVLTGTPVNKEVVAAAWTEALTHVERASSSANSFLLTKGSYFIIGGEKLVLDQDSLSSGSIAGISGLIDAARNAGSLVPLTAEDGTFAADEMRLFIAEDSIVGFGGASLRLDDEVTVNIKGVKVAPNILTSIKNAPSKDDAMNKVMDMAQQVLLTLGGKEGNVYIDVKFSHICKHEYSSVVTGPTCTEDGYTTYTCSDCKHSYKEEGEKATGHVAGPEEEFDCTCPSILSGKDFIKKCTVCGEEAERRHVDAVIPETPAKDKVVIDVTSGSATGKLTVNEKYVVTATTEKGKIANADQISATVTMKDIAGLGIGSEGRTHTMNLALNTGKGDINLDYWFEKVDRNLDITKVLGSVCGTNEFVYAVNNVSDDTKWEIVAAPEKADDVSAAWQKVLADGHITPATTGDGDSRVIIKDGASIQINAEVLELTDGDVTIANANNLGALEEVIRKAATLTKVATSFDGIIVKIPAESKVYLGSSLVTLEDDATITIEGIHLGKGVLTQLKAVTDMNGAFNALFNLAFDALQDEDATIKVDVDFAHGNEGGNQGGNEGGNQGGNQGGNEGGNQGGNEGGNQGGNEGGNQGGNEGGNQGGNQGGNNQGGNNQGGNNQGGNNQGGNNQGGTGNKPSAPVTADNSAIAFYVVLAAVAAVVAVVSRKRFAR